MKLFLSLLPLIGSVLALAIPEAEADATLCTCETVFCTQVWPDSCYCANNAKKACYEKCGGSIPVYDVCPPRDVTTRAPESEPVTPPSTCVCEEVYCILSWPEGCYCANNAKKACFEKCGGEEPTYQNCDAPREAKPKPKPTNQVCGGGRGSPYLACPSGQKCIPDPFTPGSCGPACDGLGICVEDKMCGGIAGFPCDKKGQVCVDDPTDDCDPKQGGADCAGVCVWPQ